MGDEKREEAEEGGSIDDPAYQKAVFEDAYRQTVLQLSNGDPDSDFRTLSLINAGRNAAINEIASDFASEDGAECASGCSYCCHQMVLCTPFEIFDIARHVLDTRQATEISILKERLARLASLPLDIPSHHGADKPCALLEDDCCTIYEHRPSLCRTMLSTSRIACETNLNSKQQEVPFISEPVVISFLMQLGIDYALITQKHVSTEKVEMSRALFMVLGDFETMFRNWIDGQDIFPDCHVGGSSNNDLAETAARQCGVA